MLANTEIQALITAIGTGVRDEFDIDEGPVPQGGADDRRRRRRRPHPDAGADAVVPRDAAADRGRLRVHRQAAAVPADPGKKHRYLERESELEDILLGDKFEKIEVYDRYNKPFKLTEARWKRFTRLLKQYEGWASALRAAHGHGVVVVLAAGAAARGADRPTSTA